MSDPTVNQPKHRAIGTPDDYAQTVADAAKHRAEPGAPIEYGTSIHEAVEAYNREHDRRVLGIDDDAKLAALRRQLSEQRRGFEPDHVTIDDGPALSMSDFTLGEPEPYRMPAEQMKPDVEPFLPFRRHPERTCASCGAWPREACDPGCLSTMTDEQQRLHRDAVIDRTLDELDREYEAERYRVISCEVGAGRHREPTDPRRPFRRIRAVLVVAVVVLVLALGAPWASTHAKAESFDVCPSGLTGVATADTSCAFADSVRASFYWQPSWTVFAKSPVTGKFYTMQCSRTDTTGTGWLDSKRCFGLNDAGVALIVFIA